MNNKRRLFFGLLVSSVIFILFFIFAPKTRAAGDHLVINEIYPAPLSGEKEWVELYNPTGVDTGLVDYSLKDGGVAAKNLSGIISAGDYFIFEVSSGWLNNSGETLSLIYKPTSAIVDEVAYGNWDDGDLTNNAVAPSNSESISRIPNGQDTDIDTDDFRIVPVTKGKENILPPPVVYSNQIYINEILPQPATGSADEYIEIYNSGNGEIDLSGWQIDDISGGSSPYNIPVGTKISGGEHLSFYNPTTKISLNDSGDSARLIDPNGDVKSEISYSKAIRGQSYSRFSDSWQWTLTLTPNGVNVLTLEVLEVEEIGIGEVDIPTARQIENGQTVTISGIVSVVPNTLSTQYFYIQDANSGIQIYNYNKNFPALNVGDEIQATGELSEYKNEKRLKITSASDIVVISNKSPPEAIRTEIDNLSEGFEGRYVVIRGTVSKTSGNTFYVHGSGEIQVVIRDSTGIKKPKMRTGDIVEIAGILSQYGDYYRILPTRQGDVKIIKSSTLAKSGMDFWLYIILAIFLSALWIILQKVNSRQKNWLEKF